MESSAGMKGTEYTVRTNGGMTYKCQILEPSRLGKLISFGTAGGADARAAFDRLLGELRPKLHRYCARMAGSVIDGEDVLQDALMKAIKAYPHAGPLMSTEGWLFRIAHNAALDFLRQRTRQDAITTDTDPT